MGRGTWLLLALLGCKEKGPGNPNESDPSRDDTGDDTGDPTGDDTGTPPIPNKLQEADDSLWDDLLNRPVDLVGNIVDPTGAPLAGVTIEVLTIVPSSTGSGVEAQIVGDAETDADGAYAVRGLPRHNAWIRATLPGRQPELVPIATLATDDAVEIAPVALFERRGIRALFAGDTAFGRRFLDPDESTPRDEMPPDDAEALIQVSDPAAGTWDVVSRAALWFENVDYRVLNLETPVTDEVSTPHETKDYAFFTLPGSLDALIGLGIDYVSLGNNHVYDYLEQGLADTHDNLDAIGLLHSGSGFNSDEAYVPLRVAIDGHPYSFVSMSSVSGDEHPITYMAEEDKGGSADLRDSDAVAAVIGAELDVGRTPIAFLHTGQEYTHSPSEFAQERMDFVADAGAALVVGHHTHMAQGFAERDGVLEIQCLGNFAFDQDRHETMLGEIALVDIEDGVTHTARVVPVYVEDYRPRAAAGDLAARLLRRVAEMSSVPVVPYQAAAWARPVDTVVIDRTVDVPVTVPESGVAVVDLRTVSTADESLRTVTLDVDGATVRPGRDMMMHGTMEDDDVDEDDGEARRWDLEADSRSVCTRAHQGAFGLCSYRQGSNDSESVISFANRVRVWGDAEDTPNKDMSLVAWVSGENAGPIRLVTGYYSSDGDAEYGFEDAVVLPGGTFDWTMVSADMDIPADDPDYLDDDTVNARAVRVFLHHGPPKAGDGVAAYDDVAFVAWEERLDPVGGAVLATPHARDFLRVEATPGAATLTLTFRRELPVWAE